jgi:hypothetical protein
MTLPENFDSWEHLQKIYNIEYNKRVDRYFKDVPGPGDLSSPRASTKLACRLVDGDNIATWEMRTSLFFDVIGYGRKNLAVMYGSAPDTAPAVAGHPKLYFTFSQDESASTIDGSPVQHEKSVRLMKFACKSGESKPAITKAQLIDLANEIKNLFIVNSKGITYTTGNKSASYTDPENGFPKGNYMLVNSKADASEIYQKIANVIDVPFDSSRIIVNDPDKPSTTTSTAGTSNILGKTVKNRPYRPVAVLRFRYAYISLGNVVPPIFLIDTTFRNQSLVKLF